MDDKRIKCWQYYSVLLSALPKEHYYKLVFARCMTDGLLAWEYAKDYDHWPALLECSKEVVGKMADLPFAGRITLAKVMVDAMLLLREEYGVKAPACWYPIIKSLRKQKHVRCMYAD
jgi:hypothetical protein